MYCPLCPGQIELQTGDGVSIAGVSVHSAICPKCGFGARAPSEEQVQDILSTLWCFLPRATPTPFDRLHNRLAQFLGALEHLSENEVLDACVGEALETGGKVTWGDQCQIDLHGYVGTGDSLEAAIQDWREAVPSRINPDRRSDLDLLMESASHVSAGVTQ